MESVSDRVMACVSVADGVPPDSVADADLDTDCVSVKVNVPAVSVGSDEIVGDPKETVTDTEVDSVTGNVSDVVLDALCVRVLLTLTDSVTVG